MDPELDSEQAGFDAMDEDQNAGTQDTSAPTETPGQGDDEGQRTAEPAAPEYVQWTKAEYDEFKARAALIDEMRTTQDKSFGTFGRTIKGLSDKLEAIQAGSNIDIPQGDIDLLREDFPALAATMEKVRNMRVIPGAGVDQAQIETLVNSRVSAVEQKFELRLLAKDHPDWKQIDADPAFAQWVAAQPDEFKQELTKASLAYDSSAISDVMSKFKQARKAAPAPTQAPTQRTSRMKAAETPRGTGKTHANTLSDEQSGFDSVT
jgi:hypothetical protein